MKKLIQAVKTTLPALVDAMETLRANMIVFRYQLRHISRGKYKLGQYLDSAKPTLTEYLTVVQKIPKAKELNAKIAELTEDLEELKSEKSVLLDRLNCTDDAGISTIKKDIAAAEAGLSKLEQQETKYASELEAALSEYAALKDQGADFDPAELYAQRTALRQEKTAEAVQRIQSAYGEKFDSLVMFDSKRDVNELLHEDAEERAYKREQALKKRQVRREQKHRTDPER